MADAVPDTTPTEPRQFLIRLPRPLWIGLAAAVLVVVASGPGVGVPNWRQHTARQEIHHLGGVREVRFAGPQWCGILWPQGSTIMNRMIVNSRIGSDGILHVTVPMGPADADRPVRVTIEPAETAPAEPGEYPDWLRSVAGKWKGAFERPWPGPIEEREPLS